MMLRIFALAWLLVSPASAAASQFQSLVVPAFEYVPGKKPAIKETTIRFADAAGRSPFVVLYWNPAMKGTVDELRRFDKVVRDRRASRPAERIRFFSAVRVVDGKEQDAVEAVIRELQPVVPTLVDRSLSVAAAMEAQFIPAYYGENKAGKAALVGYGSLGETVAQWGTLEIALRMAGDDLPDLVKPKPRPLAVGDRAPHFNLTALDGRPVLLHDELRNNKPVLLLFWSVYCQHCQRELPKIQKWLAENPKAYRALSITRMINPEDFAATTDFALRHGFGFPILNDGGQTMLNYQIQGFPTWMVIDPQGKVVTIQNGEKGNLDALLAKYAK